MQGSTALIKRSDIMKVLSRNRDATGILSIVIVAFLMSGITTGSVRAQDTCEADDNTIRMNYSLYAEYWRNKSFDSSLPYLRWILKCAPGFPSGSDRNYRRAVDVYEGIGLASEDLDIRRTYLDSALYIHDVAVPNLKDAGFEADPFNWMFNKGRFMQSHPVDLEDIQHEVGGVYQKAFEIDAARLEPYYINFIISDLVIRDQKTNAIEFMEVAENAYGDSGEYGVMIKEWRGRLFTSPEERIEFIEGQLADDPDNVELVSDLFNLYVDEEMRDMVYDLAPRLMELDPTAKTFRLVAKMRLDDGDTDGAIELYNQSLEMDDGQDSAMEVYYNIGVAHQQEGRLSRARTSYRQALRVDSGYGEALMSIGDLYVAAVQGCGSFEREDRAVYWLAADYFERARRLDDRVSAQIRSRLSTLSQLYPTAEDKFFKNWTTGGDFRIDYGCYTWIGESTRVR
ncbi:MAG: tetratricopeptide repeat protein [Bacteroidetes bacterium]|nr:MAG: tetratricopeptide repeat protein [Bacteroidota bacterium]